MHEVRVYNSKGELKKVITEKTLKARSDYMILNPAGYGKPGKKAAPQIPTASKRKQPKSA